MQEQTQEQMREQMLEAADGRAQALVWSTCLGSGNTVRSSL